MRGVFSGKGNDQEGPIVAAESGPEPAVSKKPQHSPQPASSQALADHETPFFLLALCPLLSAWAQPNILLILADDCTFSDLAIYGGQNAKTPNIDRLASQGLVFEKAYVTAAMCQPCRAELYTGQQPMRNGCAWNHSACRPETKSLPHHLAPAGYRTGIAGKVHVTPKPCFPLKMCPALMPMPCVIPRIRTTSQA
jgi:hypothetical protein